MNRFFALLNRADYRQMGLVSGVIALVSMILYGLAAAPGWWAGLSSEDGWFYAVVARNLADGYGYRLNPGGRQALVDGPGWAFLWGGLDRIGAPAVAAGLGCGLLIWGLTLWLALRLNRRVAERRAYGWIAVPLLALHPWTAQMWTAGTESALATLLLVAGLWVAFRRVEAGRNRVAWTATLLVALAASLRPELWPVGGLLVIDDLYRRFAQPRKPNWVMALLPRLTTHLMIWLGVMMAYAFLHYRLEGWPLPASLERAAGGAGVPALLSGRVPTARLGDVLLTGLMTPAFWLGSIALAAPPLVPLFGAGLMRFLRRRTSLLPLWILVVPAAVQGWLYPAPAGATVAEARYAGPLAAVYLLVCAAGVTRLFPMRRDRRRWFVAWLGVAVASATAVVVLETVFTVTRWRPDGLTWIRGTTGTGPAAWQFLVLLLLLGLIAAACFWAVQRTGQTRVVQANLLLISLLWLAVLTVGPGVARARDRVARLNRGPRWTGAYLAEHLADLIGVEPEEPPRIGTDHPGTVAFSADLPVRDLRPWADDATPEGTAALRSYLMRREVRPSFLFYEAARYPGLRAALGPTVTNVSHLPPRLLADGWEVLQLTDWRPVTGDGASGIGFLLESEPNLDAIERGRTR